MTYVSGRAILWLAQADIVRSNTAWAMDICVRCSVFFFVAERWAVPSWTRPGDQTGGPWATLGLRRLVTRPAELFLNLLAVTTRTCTFSKESEKIVIFMSAVLHTSATHSVDFKSLQQIYIYMSM
jgi:hypothetical protein